MDSNKCFDSLGFDHFYMQSPCTYICYCCCVLLRSAVAMNSPAVVWPEENTLPIVVLGALQLSVLHLFLGVSMASIVGGRKFLSFHQLSVTACLYRCCIAPFPAFLVQVTAPTPQTTGRLLAVSPDMAELLAVVNSESKLYYDRRSVGQSVFVFSIHPGPITRFYYCQTVAGLLMFGTLSDKRTAGQSQR
jgi:hypothetical protein